MASVGRGRGRGRGAIFLKDQQQPGGLQKQDSIDELISKVAELSVDIEDDKINACVEIAKNKATSKSAIENIVKTIYNPCYKDWRLSGSAAQIFSEIAHVEAEGVKVRGVLLSSIQADFKGKEDIRSVNLDKFMGCCACLCQVFNVLKVNGAPMKPLTGSILDYLELLLDNKAEEIEIECACEQLLSIGPLLHIHADAGRLSKIRNAVRDKVLDTKLSRDLRMVLIDLVEAFASQWTLHVND